MGFAVIFQKFQACFEVTLDHIFELFRLYFSSKLEIAKMGAFMSSILSIPMSCPVLLLLDHI